MCGRPQSSGAAGRQRGPGQATSDSSAVSGVQYRRPMIDTTVLVVTLTRVGRPATSNALNQPRPAAGMVSKPFDITYTLPPALKMAPTSRSARVSMAGRVVVWVLMTSRCAAGGARRRAVDPVATGG